VSRRSWSSTRAQPIAFRGYHSLSSARRGAGSPTTRPPLVSGAGPRKMCLSGAYGEPCLDSKVSSWLMCLIATGRPGVSEAPLPPLRALAIRILNSVGAVSLRLL